MMHNITFDDPRDAYEPAEMLQALQEAVHIGICEPLLDENGNQVWQMGKNGHEVRVFRSLISE